MARLTREKVLSEIYQLNRLAALNEDRIERLGDRVESTLRDEQVEAERYLRLAQQFTSTNVMDFRAVELALTDLRRSINTVRKSLDEVEVGSAKAEDCLTKQTPPYD